MANTITAGNATNGGTAISSDTSGVLELKTGSSPTTAIAVDASQNVGIGTSSPAQKLHVNGGTRLDGNVESNASQYIYSWAGGSSGQVRSGIYLDGTNSTLALFAGQAERMRIDSSGNLLVGTTSQIKSSKQSIYSGATNATTYNTASFQGGSVLTVQNQQTTSVSTSAVVIATTALYATLALVYGSDGTNRFQDLVMFGLATGTVNVISSLAVSGSPASRTYSQSSSTYRLQMGSGTYTVQFSGLSQGD